MTTGRDCLAPSALEVVAGTLAAVIAPPAMRPPAFRHDEPIVRDAGLLATECYHLSRHLAAADHAGAELAATRAIIDGTCGRTGRLAVSVPPDLGRRLRAEAARLGEEPAALATEILALVLAPGSESLVEAVLGANRPTRSAHDILNT